MKRLGKFLACASACLLSLLPTAATSLSVQADTQYPDWTSTNHDNNSESSASYSIVAEQGDYLCFDYAVSSEGGYDFLNISFDGAYLGHYSGLYDGTVVLGSLPAGSFEFSVSYSKDGSENSYDDQVTVSGIQLMPSVNINGNSYLLHSGKAIYVGWKWNWTPDSVAYEGATYPVQHLRDAIQADYRCSKVSHCTLSALASNNWSTINQNTFNGCANIVSVTLPSTVKEIRNGSFYGCTALTAVELSDSLSYLDASAFDVCGNLQTFNISSEALNYTTSDGVLYSKEMNQVLAIPRGKTGSYVLPASVTEVASSTFYGCSNLTSITLHDGLTSLPSSVFQGCSSLTEVTLPSGLSEIPDYAFYDCSKLSSIALPTNVTTIGTAAFCGTSFTSFTIPNSVVSVGYWIFSNCPQLTEITVGRGVESLTEFAGGANSLQRILVDENNPYFCSQNGVLFSKDKTTLLAFPDARTGFYAIPMGVSVLGVGAFDGCQLSQVSIPEGVTEIGEKAFYGCFSLTSVSLPSSLRIIGALAFCDDYNICSVNIPEGVTEIGDQAFNWSGLRYLSLPESLTRVGKSAFAGCGALREIVVAASQKAPSLGENAFSDISSDHQVFVDDTGLFTNSFGWKDMNIQSKGSQDSYGIDLSLSGCGRENHMYYENKSFRGAGQYTTFASTSSPTFNFGVYWPYRVKEILYDGNDITDQLDGNQITLDNLYYWGRRKLDVKFGLNTDNDYGGIIYLNDETDCYTGSSIVLPVMMKNYDNVAAFQFDLILPAGVTVQQDQNGRCKVEASARLADTHSISSNITEEGYLRVIANSLDNDCIEGNEGVLLNITLNVDEHLLDGNTLIWLSNVLLNSPSGDVVNSWNDLSSTLAIHTFMVGDANGDRTLNVADVTTTVLKALGKTPDNFLAKAADVNEDGYFNTTDITRITNLILYGNLFGANGGNRQMRYFGSDESDALAPAFSMDNLAMNVGEVQNVEIRLNTFGQSLANFQFDLALPKGIRMTGCMLHADDSDHALSWSTVADGQVRLLCNSLSNDVLSHDGSAVITLQLMADPRMMSGIYTLTGSEIVACAASGDEMDVEPFTAAITIDATTGLDMLQQAKQLNGYTLDGKRVDAGQKGICVDAETGSVFFNE